MMGTAMTHGTSYGWAAFVAVVMASTCRVAVCKATRVSCASCVAPSQV